LEPYFDKENPMSMKRYRLLGLAMLALVSLESTSSADGHGSDMWTRDFEQRGLFTPHHDNCNSSTEAFVSVAGSGRGYCMEKSERTSETWEIARNNCATDGKRLAEPAEWKIACSQAGTLGLSDMTGN
jgi:hypothetical protein